MSRIIIGLAGKKGSGKDTLASVLVKKHGFSRLAFGDRMKDLIHECLGVSKKYLYDEKLKDSPFPTPVTFTKEQIKTLLIQLNEYDSGFRDSSFDNMLRFFIQTSFITPRQVMQFVATDVVRDYFDENTWVDMLVQDLNNLDSNKIVITDCRMYNERNLVRSLGGKLGLVVRDNCIDKNDSHISENNLGEVNEYDYVFTNNSDLTAFQHEIDLWATLKFS